MIRAGRALGAAALALVLALQPVAAAAHGTTFTMQYVDGPNLVGVNQNVHDLVADVPVDHQIRLRSVADGQLVPYEHVTAAVSRGDREIARQVLTPGADGDADLTYTFRPAGSYTLALEFLAAGRTVGSARFPLVVGTASGAGRSGAALGWWLLVALAGFTAGAASTRVYDSSARAG